MLAGMIVKLRKRKRDGNISKVTGSSAGIAGGIMLITGFALIPVTFGASLGLSIAGTAMGVAGSITAAGASIAVTVMNKASTKEATENIEKDKIAGEKLAKVVESVSSAASEFEVVTMGTLLAKRVCAKGGTEAPVDTAETAKVAVGGIFAAGGTVKGVVNIVKNSKALVKVATTGAIVADDVASAVVKGAVRGGLRIAGVAVISLLLVVDVVSLIRTGVELHKDNPSETEAHWQETYDDLKLHLISMEKINDYAQRIRK
ncbi:uncharacterized protein LOC116956854 [Petromyzon marinus]|uniref:Uncharacterized protein LOC116956854 n=1 Tax=Petromyzon marinus TaxID=7757 RepID=A0AAJ7UE28_PETMA|nr:uncharacterized protein LOC116956854 [Petromyzon marinus]